MKKLALLLLAVMTFASPSAFAADNQQACCGSGAACCEEAQPCCQ